MNVRMLAGATLAIVGLIATGCGGSSSSSTTSTALTKSEFLAKGNAICAKGNKTISQAAKQTFGNSKPSASQVNQFVTQTVIPSIQDEINGIKALPAPSGDEAKVSAIAAGAQGALDKAKANPKLLTERGGADPFAAVNKLANAYGLTK